MHTRPTFPQRACSVVIRLSAAAALLLAAAYAGAAPRFERTELWGLKEDGYVSHFVYGIGVTWNDTILVACEGRVGGADAAEKDLLLKRSTDGGTTWSEDVVLEGKDDTYSWSNPTFVTDGVTTYLFYAQSVSSDIGRVFVRKSTDNGVTWSERTELTHLWENNPHGWTQHSTIGHGIKKLKDPERGRVLVAFHHRGRVAEPPARRGYGNDVIQLTPDGWTIAGSPAAEPARGTNEARLAERADGSLMLLARQASGNNQLRARSDSADGGQTWTPWSTQADIRGTVCDGGLLRFSDACHLASFPSSLEKSAQKRSDLVVKASADGGVSWGPGRLVQRGQATYSDLARDSLGNVYCIYGADGSDFMGDRVYVAKFNPEWLTGRETPTLIIDNTDEGFSTQGDWNHEAAAIGYYGSNYAVSRDPDAAASWRPVLSLSGAYEVYVRWPSAADHAAAVTVDIIAGAGAPATRRTFDQRTEGGAWQHLGAFDFAAGEGAEVRLMAASGAPLVADAVMFQKL